MSAILLILTFFELMLAPLAAKEPTLTNGMAAKVGSYDITIQDAYWYRFLERFVGGSDHPLEMEKGVELRRTVQRLVLEQMVLEEVKDLDMSLPKKAEIQSHLKKSRTKPGRESLFQKALKTLGRTEAEAVEQLTRKAHVDLFLKKKMETLMPIITQAEVMSYLEQNSDKLVKRDGAPIEANVRILLQEQRLERNMEEWVNYLKGKYKVTNYLEL